MKKSFLGSSLVPNHSLATNYVCDGPLLTLFPLSAFVGIKTPCFDIGLNPLKYPISAGLVWNANILEGELLS